MTKRILIVSGDFVLTGGMDRANYALADFLARSGIQVELVAHRVSQELLEYPNVIHYRVPKPMNSYFLGSRLLANEGRRQAAKVLRGGGRVIVNGGNCAIADVNWVHYLHIAFLPEVNSLFRRIKQIIERPIALRSEKRCLTNARLIIANSELTKATIADRFGIANSKVKTVYYGTDNLAFFPPSESERKDLRGHLGWDNAPRVVFIGALGDRRKGFDTLSKAWSHLIRDENWSAKLVVIGTGAEHKKWKAEWAGKDNRGSAEFLGFRTDVPELLRASDCLVSPTRYEAYGLGVHEALCCGLAVIVSKNAGVSECLPPECRELTLVDPTDVDELISKLKAWFSNQRKYRLSGQQTQRNLSKRSWDDMAGEILATIS